MNLLRGDGGEFKGWVNGGNGTLATPDGQVVKLGWRDALISGVAK